MRRKGHFSDYETMLESLMRSRLVPYVAVNEKRRPVTARGPVKNFDFIIHSGAANYIADVKGKLFPQETKDKKTKLMWQNWINYSDLEGLGYWQRIMGNDFKSILIFTYRIVYEEDIFRFWDLYNYGGESYGLVACYFNDYMAHAKLRSKKWNAYFVPKNEFIKIQKPLREFIPEIAAG